MNIVVPNFIRQLYDNSDVIVFEDIGDIEEYFYINTSSFLFRLEKNDWNDVLKELKNNSEMCVIKEKTSKDTYFTFFKPENLISIRFYKNSKSVQICLKKGAFYLDEKRYIKGLKKFLFNKKIKIYGEENIKDVLGEKFYLEMLIKREL